MIDNSERAIMLRYHEIAIKGDNRRWFEDRLAINARRLIKRALGREAEINIELKRGRVIVNSKWTDATREALGRVFGISSFSPMRAVETQKETILAAALEEFETHIHTHGLPTSFRVQTRRSDKALPEQSIALDHFFGGEINDRWPEIKVDLKRPALTLGIEIRFKKSFIWLEKFSGPGGLPVGTNGNVLALLSGGLDSPIAAIRILKRGSPVSFLHFHGAPFVGEEVLEKVEDLASAVNRLQPDPAPLHVVPFGKIQEKVALATNPKLRTIIYRRLMVRVACRLATQIYANAIVTGESLGQVASQTIENIAAIDSATTLPILRPLIGFDKDEIIREAHHWGTFEISVRPGTDCCTLFADRHPTLRANVALIREQEERLAIEDLVKEAIDGVLIRRARY